MSLLPCLRKQFKNLDRELTTSTSLVRIDYIMQVGTNRSGRGTITTVRKIPLGVSHDLKSFPPVYLIVVVLVMAVTSMTDLWLLRSRWNWDHIPC
jgi:hypothetical protein